MSPPFLRFDETSIKQRAARESSVCYLYHVSILLGLFFNPEDEGDMFLWNIW
jgi:hypothetical protein